MSDVLIPGGAGGSVYSEDVTADKSHVLNGRTTITSDSNDEIVEGTMPDNSTRTSNGNVVGLASHPTVPTRDGVNMHIQPDTAGVAKLHMAPPAGYYNGGSYVSRPAAELGDAQAAHVQHGITFTSAAGVRITGTVPLWVMPGSNAVTVYNGESTVWDDEHLGRGRGILARLPKGAKIDADWAFVPAPDMRPENIRQGKVIAGMTGTMVDYSAGRVVFHNATFDGALVSGVARANTANRLDPAETARIEPARPFFRHLRTDPEGYYPHELRTVFRHSLNLTPFSRMRIQYRCNGRAGYAKVPYGGNFYMFAIFWSPSGSMPPKQETFFNDRIMNHDSGEFGWREFPWVWAEVDISDINEQVFVGFLYRTLHEGGEGYRIRADFDIAYIELIN